MASYFPVGEPVGVPPVGHRALAIDGTGSAYLLDPTGTRIPVGSGGFGSDTKISLNNAVASPVTALQMQTSLTTLTAGSEASKVIMKVLQAGAQANGLEVYGDHVIVPAGAEPTAAQNSGIMFQGMGRAGIWADPAGSGRIGISFSPGNLGLRLGGDGVLDWGGSFLGFGAGLRGLLSLTNGHLQIYGGNVSGGDADLIPGKRLGMTTTETAGFLSIPSCAGTPTGVPIIATDFPNCIPLVTDRTASKLWARFGGTWKSVTFV